MTLEIPSQEGNTFARNGDHKAMHTAFALVRSLGHAASQSVKAVRHAVAVERYVLEAARAGHCRATALRYLEDELLDRASRGLCDDVRCAADRAVLRMAEADRFGADSIPGQRTVIGELAGRDWFQSPTPTPVLCLGCGNPIPTGQNCRTCAAAQRRCPECWELLADDLACRHCVPQQNGQWPPPGFQLCLGCHGAVRLGQFCPVCTQEEQAVVEEPQHAAALADAWVLDTFGADTLEALPNLCQHPNENRWELADGTLAVRCSDCGASMVGAEPGAYPFLPPSWVFADGTVVEDV